MHFKARAAAVLSLLIAAGLLIESGPVSQGVLFGVNCCFQTLIPSLFPFLILACLLGSTSAGTALCNAVSKLLRPIVGIPQELGAVLLMSWIGGFPVGAKMISEMRQQKRIDSQTAEHALACCVNAGPCFLITAVGAGMLGNKMAGFLLLGAQILSSLLICAVHFRFSHHQNTAANQKDCIALPAGGASAFVQSVHSASSAMLSICAFVTAFCAINALLDTIGFFAFVSNILHTLFPAHSAAFFHAACTGIFEVTSGCMAAAPFGTNGLLLCAFLVSFSSISIIFQVLSFFGPGSGVRFGPFLRSRFLHGLLTTLFVALGTRFLPESVLAACATFVTPVAKATPNMLLTGGCIIAMFTLVMAIPAQKQFQRASKQNC